MSGKILIARHGETDWKFRGRLQGISPVPINEHGKEQAKMLTDHLIREYGMLEAIHTSPLHRAKQTANAVYAGFDQQPEWVVDEPISEVDWGVWQGMQLGFILQEFPEFDYNENGRNVLDVTPSKGESLNELKERVQPYWQQFCTHVGESDAEHPFLLITHEHPIDAIMAEVGDDTYYDFLLNHEHEPIEIAEVNVDDEGDVVSYMDPSPPWNTV